MKKGILVVLRDFFGYRPAMENASLDKAKFDALSYDAQVQAGGMRGFAAEYKRLSDQEKVELAQLAAKAQGFTQADVDFNLG